MKVVNWIMGQPHPVVSHTNSVCISVTADDGQVIQFQVYSDGSYHIRGWGNAPEKLGNGTQMSASGHLYPQEPTHCGVCYNKLEENCRCQND